jgi:hypothetical protein
LPSVKIFVIFFEPEDADATAVLETVFDGETAVFAAGLFVVFATAFVLVIFGGVGVAAAPEKTAAPVRERLSLLKNADNAPSAKTPATNNLAVFFILNSIRTAIRFNVNNFCVEQGRVHLFIRRCFGGGVGVCAFGEFDDHLFVAFVAVEVCRIVACEGTAAVVALQAVESGKRAVFEGGYAVDLSSLRLARLNSMTFVAGLACVVLMAENYLRAVLRRQRSYVRRDLVADVAGIVFVGRHLIVLRVVANVAGGMRLKT